MLLKTHSENTRLDTEAMIRMNTDAMALQRHVSFKIVQRRHDVIWPNLNKDYAMLCALHLPITFLLFGDELQTQLNHTSASNKISSVVSTSTFVDKQQYAKPQTSSKQWRPFLDKTPLGNQLHTYRKPAQFNSWKKCLTNRMNDRK